MTQEEFNKLVKKLLQIDKENEWIEFKENDYNELGEYISALSNSACLHEEENGYIIFGIEDGTKTIKGTSFKPKTIKKGNEEYENWLTRLLKPRIDFEIYDQFKYNNLPVIIIKISATHNMPVSFSGTEYIRVGSYKKKLKDFPEKERKIWQKTRREIFDNNVTLKDTTEDTILNLLDYTSYFSLMSLPLPDNRTAIINKLLEEKIILNDNLNYHITNLGAILFAKNLSSFENLSRKAVRVIKYKERNRLKTIKEKEYPSGYAAGFEDLINYINDMLPTNEVINKTFREVIRMYPEIAIRELVANALIHQDFNIPGSGPMIEIFEDRIEISNPGKTLISPLRFIDHMPLSRNENLARFMRRLNICEERGSGIDKAINAIEEYQLPALAFIDDDIFLKVIIYSYKSLRKMDKKDKIRACYQHCCLKYVSNEFMTNQSLRKRFKIEEKNYSTASRIISETIKENLIKDYDSKSKSKKYARYIPFWA